MATAKLQIQIPVGKPLTWEALSSAFSNAVVKELVLSDASVTIGDSSILANHLANNAVVTAKIAEGSVTAVKIGAGAVTTEKLAEDLVLADGQLTLCSSSDATRTASFSLSGVSAETPRTYALPDKSGTVALISDVDALDLSAMLRFGSGEPDADLGNDGDFYEQSGDRRLLWRKASGAWVSYRTDPSVFSGTELPDPADYEDGDVFLVQAASRIRLISVFNASWSGSGTACTFSQLGDLVSSVIRIATGTQHFEVSFSSSLTSPYKVVVGNIGGLIGHPSSSVFNQTTTGFHVLTGGNGDWDAPHDFVASVYAEETYTRAYILVSGAWVG